MDLGVEAQLCVLFLCSVEEGIVVDLVWIGGGIWAGVARGHEAVLSLRAAVPGCPKSGSHGVRLWSVVCCSPFYVVVYSPVGQWKFAVVLHLRTVVLNPPVQC